MSNSFQQFKGPFVLSVVISVTVWVLLLITVIIRGGGIYKGKLSRLGMGPAAAPVTVPFDTSLRIGSSPMPLDDWPLARTAAPNEPEQIHLALGGSGGMYVSWVVGDAKMFSTADDVIPVNMDSQYAIVYYATEPFDGTEGAASMVGTTETYMQTYPGAIYRSGIINHVLLENLMPSTTYFYKCGNPLVALSKLLNFTTPVERGSRSFPQRVGVIGDLGASYNSSSTLSHLMDSQPPMVILLGDFVYADSFLPDGVMRSPDHNLPYPTTYQPRWDGWGRFMQPLISQVPMMVIEGNHEIEEDSEGNTFTAYRTRYRMPHRESGSPSPLFYSFDYGATHFAMIGAYAEFGPDSEQIHWLQADLAAVDRSITPWLVAIFHPPMYNTYVAHYKELECFQQAVEPLLYEYGVNLVLAGHVHAYERHNPVFNFTLDPCGPVHITVGDGGNTEALYIEWVDWPVLNCPDPRGRCDTFQDGDYCPVKQPSWSAYREPSFGHGVLEVEGEMEATWTWHRNQDGARVAADAVTLRRNPTCHNQQIVARR